MLGHLNYDELSARAERGELAIKPGTLRKGAAARSEANRLLQDATVAAGGLLDRPHNLLAQPDFCYYDDAPDNHQPPDHPEDR